MQLRAKVEQAVSTALPEALGLGLAELSVVRLSEFGAAPLCGDGDVVAAVTTRFFGALDGTVIVALEPQDALALVQSVAPSRQPLDAFVGLGHAVAKQVVQGLLANGRSPQFGAGVLDERPLAAIVISTHAPSDTAVLGARLAVATSEDHAVSVFVYVLLDPKLGLRMIDIAAA